MCQFSVVIPTFNRIRLVQRDIDSALNQTLPAKQVIVVDDGSTDGTDEACKKYGDAIQYIRQENAGVSAARNHGIRLARHPWTAFLDSDDYWTSTHLEKVAAAIHATSGRARFYFTNMTVPDRGKSNTIWTKIGFQVSGPCHLEQDGTAWMLSQRQPSSLQCSVFNTSTLQHCGGFASSFIVMEDTELFCRLGVRGPVCAVNTIGCIQTADDDNKNRLTGRIHSRCEDYWKYECMLWAEVLSRFRGLDQNYRRALHYNQAVAHWRLARLYWHYGLVGKSVRSILRSARSQPGLLFWLIFHGKSTGWEPMIFPLQTKDAILSNNE